MIETKVLGRVAILPLLGIILSVVGGCAGGSIDENPDIGAQRKQARIDAYGKNGIPNVTGKGARQESAQSAARRGNR